MHIKKGDLVKVISGKEKGKSGKILELNREKMRARVEGLMVVKRHVKRGRLPTAPEGGIIEKEGTIHVSNLMVMDPKTNEPTRIGRKKLENGKNVRFAKRSGELID
ncbi:50S ribosomal protein L24 [Vulgatibacter incomptus]|uniref:Large ribosomal subunit protein uL24 n=1 Tax=Vulgatibacter incomptus TaxID=1391653 RepID=A0A0K1PDG0_9BACT|nr:50S ribosomal protein L24 [Vulgatibacter incomptus]AKU91578.1 LSU ribosomal protein L24p (L26e) [Vulgatibacter incomptus]